MLYDDLVQPGKYICHHGIKGQKWGVRRYQNADGSLTEAGKKRLKNAIKYYKDTGDIKKLSPFRSELTRLSTDTDEYRELQKYDLEGYYQWHNERAGKQIYKPGIDFYEYPSDKQERRSYIKNMDIAYDNARKKQKLYIKNI